MVILHHPASGVTAMAHYDEYVRERRLQKLVHNFCEKVRTREKDVLILVTQYQSSQAFLTEVKSDAKARLEEAFSSSESQN